MQMRDFTDRMRNLVSAKLPTLASRIHRFSNGGSLASSSPDAHADKPEVGQRERSDVEMRLRDAFDRDGLNGWAKAALMEVEEEARIERAKREAK